MIKKATKSLIKNPFFKGGIFLTISNFIVGFLNYLFNSLSGKALGPSGYSEIAALFSYSALFLIPVQVVNADLIRRIGEKGKERLKYVKAWESWFLTKFKKWQWLVLPYFALTFILPRATNLSPLFSFTLLTTTFLAILSTFYSSALQGLHLFLAISVISIVVTIIKLIGPILVFLKIGGTLMIAIFIILSSLLLAILGIFYIHRAYKNILPAKIPFEKRLISLLFNHWIIITMISLLGINLYNTLDVIFVKKFFTAGEAGVYGSWSLFAKIIFYIVGPITGLSYIFFSSREQEKKHSLGLFLFLVIGLITGLGLYIIYRYFSLQVLVIIFSSKYLAIASLLPQAAIFGFLFTVLNILNGYFLAKKSRFCLIAALIAPLYFALLILFAKSIEMVIQINIITTTAIGILSLAAVVLPFIRLHFK